MKRRELIAYLNKKVDQYNQPAFIKDDPISVPHAFSKKQDIEIAGLFAALFAWGNRTTIINKTKELMQRMDNAPYSFVLHHEVKDLERLKAFKHRTFNDTDLRYFIEFLKMHYSRYSSLEPAFTNSIKPGDRDVEGALNGFYDYFFSLEYSPTRTRKHIAAPAKYSSCKRLNMFLRWMVRDDHKGVDFGLWKKITPAQLVCPIDVHVARVARHYGLLERKWVDWEAAQELTRHLREFEPADPVKYDFALFGIGVNKH